MPQENALESEIRTILKLNEDEPLYIETVDSSKECQRTAPKTFCRTEIDETMYTENIISDISENGVGIAVDYARIQPAKKNSREKKKCNSRAINDILRIQHSKPTYSSQNSVSSSNLDMLVPDLRNLDAEGELKKMISGSHRTHLRVGPTPISERRNPFFRLKTSRTYSTRESYVGEFQKYAESGNAPIVYFQENPIYQMIKRQAEVFAAVGDINSLYQILLRFPCHLYTLYLTFNLLYLAGESSEARQFLEHTMYCIGEIRRDFQFSWIDAYIARTLPFDRSSNRVIHFAISAYAYALLRQNCTITAFEVFRMLWNLDPTDPAHSLFNIEYCGFKNAYYSKLPKFLDALPGEYQVLPNLMYTKALCSFYSEKYADKTKRSKVCSDLLKKALELFPSIGRCIYQNEWREIAPNAPFDCTENSFLEKISIIYSLRNEVFWKKAHVIEWVKEVAQKISWKSEKCTRKSRDAKLALLSSKVMKCYSNATANEILGKQISTPIELLVAENEE